MPRSTDLQKTERINAAHGLLARGLSVAEAAMALSRQFTMSRRQAYRYLQQAQRASSPLPVPDQKSVFTVKLPRTLITQVRRQAGQQRFSISAWVERALRLGLEQPKSHG